MLPRKLLADCSKVCFTSALQCRGRIGGYSRGQTVVLYFEFLAAGLQPAFRRRVFFNSCISTLFQLPKDAFNILLRASRKPLYQIHSIICFINTKVTWNHDGKCASKDLLHIFVHILHKWNVKHRTQNQ